MSRILIGTSSALAASCILLTGCSGSGPPAIAPVRGQVTYQGRPLAGATVEFLCKGASRPAAGTTDNEGNYRLTTFEPNDGATIGTHVVTVNLYSTGSEASLPAPSGADNKAKSKAIDDAVKQSVRNQEMAERAKPRLPLKYTERRTSDLHKDVIKGDNVINIEVTD